MSMCHFILLNDSADRHFLCTSTAGPVKTNNQIIYSQLDYKTSFCMTSSSFLRIVFKAISVLCCDERGAGRWREGREESWRKNWFSWILDCSRCYQVDLFVRLNYCCCLGCYWVTGWAARRARGLLWFAFSASFGGSGTKFWPTKESEMFIVASIYTKRRLTCVSFNCRALAISIRLARVRYLLKWNSFSNSVSCLLVKFVRPVLFPFISNELAAADDPEL